MSSSYRLKRRRRGLPTMTAPMLAALKQLAAADAAGQPFSALPEAKPKTITALFDRDWIFISPGLDGVRYKITGRGLSALAVYEPDADYRDDGLCPTCGLRPRRISRSGRVGGYCDECQFTYDQQRRQPGHKKNPHGLCPRCQKRPRRVLLNGAVDTYCQRCDRIVNRLSQRQRQKKLLACVRRGDIPTCSRCGAPVRFTDNYVYDLCERHQAEQRAAANDRQRPGSRAAQNRRAS